MAKPVMAGSNFTVAVAASGSSHLTPSRLRESGCRQDFRELRTTSGDGNYRQERLPMKMRIFH